MRAVVCDRSIREMYQQQDGLHLGARPKQQQGQSKPVHLVNDARLRHKPNNGWNADWNPSLAAQVNTQTRCSITSQSSSIAEKNTRLADTAKKGKVERMMELT